MWYLDKIILQKIFIITSNRFLLIFETKYNHKRFKIKKIKKLQY